MEEGREFIILSVRVPQNTSGLKKIVKVEVNGFNCMFKFESGTPVTLLKF